MNQITEELLTAILPNEEDRSKWLNGYNTHFNMSPQEMIHLGREKEVALYLHWNVYGPY